MMSIQLYKCFLSLWLLQHVALLEQQLQYMSTSFILNSHAFLVPPKVIYLDVSTTQPASVLVIGSA